MVMLPKLPFMNGVRILGINKTVGIDDDFEEDDEDDDDQCFDTEEETSKESCGVGYNFSDEVEEDELKKDR